MAYREVSRMEMQEVIRRWQAGHSQRQIAAGIGLSRDTVRKYVAAAQGEGIDREGSAPDELQLSRLAGNSRSGPQHSVTLGQELLEPWGDQIYKWLTLDKLQITRVRELLANRGCPVSYPSLRRFVLKRKWRPLSAATMRMGDTPQEEEAEVGFGLLSYIDDEDSGRKRAVWALLVVLTYSRHSFLWPTCSQ